MEYCCETFFTCLRWSWNLRYVAAVAHVGEGDLGSFLAALPSANSQHEINGAEWDQSPYRPVPNVIEAATNIFSGHNVRSIANADADNLQSASACLVALILRAREEGKRFLLILTGVPGSGKTLAGLDVVHNALTSGVEQQGDIIYLSGNTPLVVVLREALARDEHQRRKKLGSNKRLRDIRDDVRARIQHINDFLRESLKRSPEEAPHEHTIVFDEAQRAWDQAQGLKKFDRHASEPALILELMSRHLGWCVCICLVGGGQEINSGEEGVFGWGEALRKMSEDVRQRWSVFAPPDVFDGGPSAGGLKLGALPSDVTSFQEPRLQLRVPQRNYRSPSLSEWVNNVLEGSETAARISAEKLDKYPLAVTRSLTQAKLWLREHGRGERRYGLVASSGARRLRADGLGTTLMASDGEEIAHWYLNPHGDVRSSFALEVSSQRIHLSGARA